MTVTHKPNRHWATIPSRINALRLLWSKSTHDNYTLTFTSSCLSAPKNAYNKIIGTSQYLNPRKKSLRLAWKPTGNGKITIAEMHETNKTIRFHILGQIEPNKTITIPFSKKYRFAINQPYFGGRETPSKTIKYTIE